MGGELRRVRLLTRLKSRSIKQLGENHPVFFFFFFMCGPRGRISSLVFNSLDSQGLKIVQRMTVEALTGRWKRLLSCGGGGFMPEHEGQRTTERNLYGR